MIEEGDKVLDFWNERATLVEKAGSQDVIAKEIEINAIAKHIHNGMHVCEFGCGNGLTAISLIKRFDINLDCYDFSPNMISEAKSLAEDNGVSQKINFYTADVREETKLKAQYDLIFTERMLINLDGWEMQKKAIRYLSKYLKPKGNMVFCEASEQGLLEINKMRRCLELEEISQPWHNCYLNDKNMEQLGSSLSLIKVELFSATYYYLSRVINAYIAKQDGIMPDYNSPINQLALKLPSFGECSQGKIWVIGKIIKA
jgi:ubiquinone/menaquinone biosynthesis C-methylase UbiE